MNNWQITILVFSILLYVGQILNIIVDINFIGWAIVISWFTTGLNVGAATTFLVGICRNDGYFFFRNTVIFLYITDVFSLFVFIIFIINRLLNWAKIVNIIIITAFIVVVHLYMKQLPPMGNYGPSVDQQQYQQMNYQVQPANYQQPQYQTVGETAPPPS